MRAAAAVAAVAAVVAVVAGARGAGAQDAEADAKVAELSRLGALGAVTDANFDRLVRSPNRPYHIFVLFNAMEASYNCALCGPFQDEVEVVAASYWRQRNSGGAADAPLIFFVRAEIGQTRRTFAEYSLQSAPVLVHYPPTTALAHSKSKFPVGGQYVGELDADNAAGFVRDRTDYKVTVYRSPWGKIVLAVMVLASMAAAVYFLGEKALDFFVSVRDYTLLWVAAGMFIYYVAVSGVLYDIIRGVPPFGYDQRTRRVIFVAQQSGTQYGVEGLMVGGLNMFAAIAAILMVRVLPYLKSTEARNYIVAGAGLLFLFLYYHVYNLYNYKNPWYSLTGLIWG